MLNVIKTTNPYLPNVEKSADELYKENRNFIFVIEAPLYWWIDVDGMKFGFNLSYLTDFEKEHLLMRDTISAVLSLSYQEIVKICEDYAIGSFKYTGESYQWPNEREWTDFCETLLDIRGVRDLIKEANI